MPPRPFSAVEKLTQGDKVDGFDCGSDPQTWWLRENAKQAHAGGTSTVYVVREVQSGLVVAYSALAVGSTLAVDSPARVTAGAGRYPIPVVLLTRLGVDVSAQGLGLGRALLVHALRTVEEIASRAAVRALLIHAESEEARSFYEHYGEFEPSPTDPLHLFLHIKDLRRELSGR